MSRSRSTGRTRAALAGAGLTLALLAGCSAEVPQPAPEAAAETPPPALDEDRLARVLENISATMAEADEALDPALLPERLTGPAVDLRSAEYRLAEATDGESAPEPFTAAPQVAAVPATEDFPRPGMVVTQPPDGSNLPLLLGIVQQNAREPYTLWGWVTLFPGITTPALTHPNAGSAVVPADADTLVATPTEVVERYVDTLNSEDSEFAEQFADDPYKETSRASATDLDNRVEAAGEVTIEAAVGDDGPVSLATADGGAIVLGEITSDLTMRKTVPGAQLRAGGGIGALLGENKEVLGTVTGTSDVLLAFYVPPAGAEDSTIQVLGANDVLTEVTRDDAAAPAAP